jgi:hypothetical protein
MKNKALWVAQGRIHHNMNPLFLLKGRHINSRFTSRQKPMKPTRKTIDQSKTRRQK